jgi:hypothetical protein
VILPECGPERTPRSSSPARIAPPKSFFPPHHGRRLAEHHARYLDERGVTSEVAEAAGYWTAWRPSEHPEAFSEYQRRRTPTLIASHYSPDGKTVSWQKRDDRPGKDRKGKVQKWVSPPGEKARSVLSVHPWMLQEVRSGAGPLWLCEGLTRGHALAPLGIAAVTYAGCYSWQKDGEPLECWHYVNLSGRLVYDVPDADAKSNENVQKAQAERVAYLESRGARVLVINVPEVNGDEHAGLDDYIAAGGDLDELARSAEPFVRVDVGRERLKRNERLRKWIAAKTLEASELPTRTVADCNAKKLARWMLEHPTPAHGKVRKRGIEIHPSFPQMAEGIRVGSYQTVSKALDRLEALGFLKRASGPRDWREAARYHLLTPAQQGGRAQSVNMEGTGGEEKERQESREQDSISLYKRDSLLCLHSAHLEVKSAPGPEKVPALRNSKLAHTFIWHEGRKMVVHSDYFKRYGPKREEIIRYVLERGPVETAELHERFGGRTSRPGRFFNTWVKQMVDDGVFVGGFGSVEVSPDWRNALERVRARGYEDEDNHRQSEKYARRRREFLKRLESEERGAVAKPDFTPKTYGPERTAEIVSRAQERDGAARVEEQRRKVGTTPETFLADALQDASGFGWRELRALWIAKGGKPEDLRRAVKPPYRFRREHDGGPLYVEKRGASEAAEPERERTPVSVLREPPAVEPDNLALVAGLGAEPVENWRSHSLDCECVWCASPMPSYARDWNKA